VLYLDHVALEISVAGAYITIALEKNGRYNVTVELGLGLSNHRVTLVGTTVRFSGGGQGHRSIQTTRVVR
jgi:hypothetical protein